MTNGERGGILTKLKEEERTVLTVWLCLYGSIFKIRRFWAYTVFVRAFFGRLVFIFVRRCLPIASKDHRINEKISAKEVRLINHDGSQLGIMQTSAALDLAYEAGFDLVEISPNAVPPVCKIMDYGKFRFESDKKEKEAKKKQQIVEVKEVQLSCRIDTHDFETKAGHAVRFLKGGDKVKVVVRFRGREMAHIEIGKELLDKFAETVSEFGSVDKPPVFEGRNMTMFIAPVKK